MKKLIGIFRGGPQFIEAPAPESTLQPLSDEALQVAIDRAAALANDVTTLLSDEAYSHYKALTNVQLYRAQLLYLPAGEPEDEVTR